MNAILEMSKSVKGLRKSSEKKTAREREIMPINLELETEKKKKEKDNF